VYIYDPTHAKLGVTIHGDGDLVNETKIFKVFFLIFIFSMFSYTSFLNYFSIL
jgi:hypothetical protein